MRESPPPTWCAWARSPGHMQESRMHEHDKYKGLALELAEVHRTVRKQTGEEGPEVIHLLFDHIGDVKTVVAPMSLPPHARADIIKHMVIKSGARSAVYVNECWIAPGDASGMSPGEDPRRQEAIIATLYTPWGTTLWWAQITEPCVVGEFRDVSSGGGRVEGRLVGLLRAPMPAGGEA